MNSKQYLTNNFLIAMPNMQGDDFSKTVTYLCQHDEEGALGLVVNKPHTMKMGDIFNQLAITAVRPEIAEVALFMGGPVQTERGFVLHTPVGDWDSTMQINEHIALTTSKDILEAIAEDKGPEKWLVALGYAGWAAGQLEQEIQRNSWLHDKAEEHIIFEESLEQRWELAAHRIGVDISLMSTESGHC
ncbi:MAG: YqgE/AlgH family protein [Cycloclasticus sp.]|nr:MAG: YqgE/AlgH family protein [Cycloclasticus sp.]